MPLTTLLHYLVKFDADILSTSLSSRTGPPAHRVRESVDLCWSKWRPNFILHYLSNSPELNRKPCRPLTGGIPPRAFAWFSLGGQCPLAAWKFDYEMVHSEVYLNKYVVSIVPFSTSECPDCSQMSNNNNNNNNHQLDQPVITRITSPPPAIQKTALFACIRFLIFHPFSRGGGQLTPFAPMCGRPWHSARPHLQEPDQGSAAARWGVQWSWSASDCASRECRKKIHACIAADGMHFEHALLTLRFTNICWNAVDDHAFDNERTKSFVSVNGAFWISHFNDFTM